MDLMWRCFVSVSAMIWGRPCVARMFCRSRMVVCIPLVLRVRAVMGGWEYACSVISVGCVGVCVLIVWLGGCWGGLVVVGSGFGCVWVGLVWSEACLGCGGEVHPLHCWMCSCVLSGLSKGRFGLLVVGFRFRRVRGGLKVRWRGGGMGLSVLFGRGGVWSGESCWLAVVSLDGFLSGLPQSYVCVCRGCASGWGSMDALLYGLVGGMW
jgi:hypothetical protein